MTKTITDLATIHVASESNNAMILWMLYGRGHASFKQMLSTTKQSPDRLRKCLEVLQKYRLVRGEIANPEDGSYLFYRLTESGTDCCEILQDALRSMQRIIREPPPDKFLIDKQAFVIMANIKGASGMRRLFDRCRVMLIDDDFAEIRNISYESDGGLDDLLDDERLLQIFTEYYDEDSSVSLEYYLRRVKRLPIREARLVASALDGGMALITDNKKMQQAARGVGVMCAGTCEALEVGNGRLPEKFCELSIGALRAYKSISPNLEHVLSKMHDSYTTHMTVGLDKEDGNALSVIREKIALVVESLHSGLGEGNDVEFVSCEARQIPQARSDSFEQKWDEQLKSVFKTKPMDVHEIAQMFSSMEATGIGEKSSARGSSAKIPNESMPSTHLDSVAHMHIIDRMSVLESIKQFETASLEFFTADQKNDSYESKVAYV